MKNEIIDSIGKLDDDIVEKTDALRQRKRGSVGLKWLALAACLLFVVGVAAAMPLFYRENNPQPIAPIEETTPTDTTDTTVPTDTTASADTTESADTTRRPIGGGSSSMCPIHHIEYHGFPDAFYKGKDNEDLANQFIEQGEKSTSYAEGECNWKGYNICTFIDLMGVSNSDICDEYYSNNYYYWILPIDSVLARDWDAVEEFYFDIEKCNIIGHKKANEDNLKEALLKLSAPGEKYEDIEYYNALTSNGFYIGVYKFSIPEFVYKTGITKAELAQIIADTANPYAPQIFEYDLDMIYSQKDYLTEQISSLPYPIMVDELIRK